MTKPRSQGMLVALAALVAVFSIVVYVQEGRWTFFSPENLSNVVSQVMIVGILAVAMTLVILIGEIDLGVGSVVAVSAVLISLMLKNGVSMPVAVLGTLLCGTLIGLWNGWWISKYRIHSFIVTLGMLVIGRGMAQIISGRQNISPNNDAFTSFYASCVPPGVSAVLILLAYVAWTVWFLRTPRSLKSLLLGWGGFALAGWVFCGARGLLVPFLLWMVAVGIGAVLLDYTPFGRHLYATGGNDAAAALSGIDTGRVRRTVFIISGLLSAVAGILAASREGGATPGNIGKLNELDAIAAVVIGGTSLMGGVGHVWGTIIGLFMLGVLANGMSILGVAQDLQEVIKGLIIIIAAWFDARTRR